MPKTPSITLELSLTEIKDRAAKRRRQVMLDAAPLIQSHYKKLSTSKKLGLDDVDPAVAKETLAFYNKVVTDGRFVKTLKTRPQAAADKLGVRIRPEVADTISRVSSHIGGDVQGPVEAVIAVAVVIVLAPKIPADAIVVDELAAVRRRL